MSRRRAGNHSVTVDHHQEQGGGVAVDVIAVLQDEDEQGAVTASGRSLSEDQNRHKNHRFHEILLKLFSREHTMLVCCGWWVSMNSELESASDENREELHVLQIEHNNLVNNNLKKITDIEITLMS
jgi:hypothetical protein